MEASLYLCSAGARKQPRPYVQRRTEIKDDPPHGPDVTRESTFYITISRAMASAARFPSWHEAGWGCSRDAGQGDFRLPVFGRRARRSVPPAFSSTVWSAYIAFLCASSAHGPDPFTQDPERRFRGTGGRFTPRPGASLPWHGLMLSCTTRGARRAILFPPACGLLPASEAIFLGLRAAFF